MNDSQPPYYPPPAPENSDVDLGVVASGCGTSCATGCASAIILMIVGASIGVEAVRRGVPGLTLFGFLLGCVGHVIVGYVTAQAARQKNSPVNLHIFIVGGMLILLTLLSLAISPNRNALAQNSQNISKLAQVVSALLVIPLMLWGASLQSDDTNSHR